MNVGLFDYGAGNLHSLAKAIEHQGASVAITDDWDAALDSDALILPGVGAFGPAVRSLGATRERVRGALADGLPCLGICLGMQILFDASAEADGPGIGRIPGLVERLRSAVVPQIGWNDVETTADPLFDGVAALGPEGGGLVAYYANSFVCRPEDPALAIAWSECDGDRFPAAVRSGSTWGVQFHPEKSSAQGLRILRNFLELVR